MQRDSDNLKDNTFDESAIKSMYDNQLAQLENLIATQRKAQMKMREQMIGGEKRYQKVYSQILGKQNNFFTHFVGFWTGGCIMQSVFFTTLNWD